MTITYERPDATVEFENKGEEANKTVGTSVFIIPHSRQCTVFDSSRHNTDTIGNMNVLVQEVSSIYT